MAEQLTASRQRHIGISGEERERRSYALRNIEAYRVHAGVVAVAMRQLVDARADLLLCRRAPRRQCRSRSGALQRTPTAKQAAVRRGRYVQAVRKRLGCWLSISFDDRSRQQVMYNIRAGVPAKGRTLMPDMSLSVCLLTECELVLRIEVC
jgi:hypothetical protein